MFRVEVFANSLMVPGGKLDTDRSQRLQGREIDHFYTQLVRRYEEREHCGDKSLRGGNNLCATQFGYVQAF